MAESNNRYPVVYGAIFSPKDALWPEVAAELVDKQIADEAAVGLVRPDVNPDERLDFSVAAVKSVLAHPNELVAFHYANESFQRLYVVVPDSERPFDLYPHGKDRTVGQFSYGLRLLYASPEGRKQPVGAIELGVVNDPADEHSISTYGGADWRKIDFGEFYLDSASADKNVAIGTDAIAELFAKLRGEEAAPSNKLFAALFQVALLADSFNAHIPVVPALFPEASVALEMLEQSNAVAVSTELANNLVVQGLGNVRKLVEERRGPIRLQSLDLGKSPDRFTLPFIPAIQSHHLEFSQLSGIEDVLRRENELLVATREKFRQWCRIVDILSGKPTPDVPTK